MTSPRWPSLGPELRARRVLGERLEDIADHLVGQSVQPAQDLGLGVGQ